jgi:hypothetical protein
MRISLKKNELRLMCGNKPDANQRAFVARMKA